MKRQDLQFPTGGTVYPLPWHERSACAHAEIVPLSVRWNAAGIAQIHRDVCAHCGTPTNETHRFAPYSEAIAAAENGSAITVLAPPPDDYYRTGRPDYFQYITSPEWREGPRRRCFEYWRGLCAICKQPGENVHHNTYARLGHELPTDVVLLCRRCHQLYEQNKPQRGGAEPWR
jgi:5-methylcytosine-specific restriction endonuclease McrA